MKRNTAAIVIQWLILIGWAAIASAETHRLGEAITLKEHLGRAWPNELIHYNYFFEPGECRSTDARIVDGNRKEIPAQLSAVTKHADGSIQSAQVWFLISLQSGEVKQLKLKSEKAVTGSDIRVLQEGDRLEVNNGLVGARFQLCEKHFEKPIPANDVPSYLAAIQLRGGAWTGRGWFETPKSCRSFKVALVESGPVFVKVSFEYRFDGFRGEGGDAYCGTAQVTSGQELIYLTEEFGLGDPMVYREPQFSSEAEELLWDWWSWRPHEAKDNYCFSFTSGGSFQPTHARSVEHNVTSPAKGRSMNTYGDNEYPLLFDTNRFEFTLNAYTMFQPDQALLFMLYRPEDPASDIISILPCRPSHWRNPDMFPHEPTLIKQHTDTSDLRVYSTAQRDVLVRCPLHLGRREWAIAVAKNPGVVTREVMDFTPTDLLLAKHGGFPLDKVKDWILEWPDMHRYAVEPAPRGSAHEKDYRNVSEILAKFIDEALTYPRAAERTGINAFPNNTANAVQKAKVLLESGKLTAEQGRKLRAQAAFLTHLLWDDDYFPPRRNGYGKGSSNMPVSVARGRMDTIVGLPDHPMSKKWLAISSKVMGYIVNANFGQDGSPQSNPHYMGLLTDAAVSTARLLTESGAINDVKTAFPNFHKAARFLVEMITPNDIRLGQRLVPTVGDGYWERHHNAEAVAPVFRESDPDLAANLLWAAQSGGIKEVSVPGIISKAPELKSVVYPGWGAFLRHGFATEAESYVGIRFGDFTLDHTHCDAGSINWYSRGVPLAMDFATMYTPHTPSAWLHGTLTYNHREREKLVKCPGRDHPDCFYTGKSWYEHPYEPNTVLQPMTDQASKNFNEVHGKITDFSSQPSADYVRGEADRHWFHEVPYYYRNEGSPSPWAPQSSHATVSVKQPFHWVRQFAFVKDEKPDGPGYLVIADDLEGNEELAPAFNFWCLAGDVKEVAPRRLYFTGQHGLDCEMFALLPAAGRIQLGEWGHKQNFLVGNPGLEENQKLARVYGPRGGQGFLAVLYPRKANEPEPKVEALANGKLVKLTLPDQTHWILLSKELATVNDGPITMSGTAAVAKRWTDGKCEIILLAKGKAACGSLTLESNSPASRKQ